MPLLQIRCSHKSLHNGKKSKLLALVLSEYKPNEEISWISHVENIQSLYGLEKNKKENSTYVMTLLFINNA